MNRKGFTLIELIAAITILAIIMAVAIPNVISTTVKNKNQTYVNDARKIVTLAKYKFESDATLNKPTTTRCLVIKLSALDKSELQKGPENGTYDTNLSFAVIKYDSSEKTYAYRVQIVEIYGEDEKTKGIKLSNYSDLLKIDAKNNNISTTGFSSSNSISGCTDIDIVS